MAKLKDLTNQVFGCLRVIKRAEDYVSPNGKKRSQWKCKCDETLGGCGSIVVKVGESLVSGRTHHCGCRNAGLIDLTGQTFKYLRVIKRTKNHIHPGGGVEIRWECLCDKTLGGCGNKVNVAGAALRKGYTLSCGCYRRESARQRTLGEGVAARNQVLYFYKAAAKKRNFSWNLTNIEAHKLFVEDCFYCGALPSNIRQGCGCRGSFTYNGIDRVDNSKGYSKDNCVACCIDCNRAKSDMTPEKFLTWLKNLSDNLGKITKCLEVL